MIKEEKKKKNFDRIKIRERQGIRKKKYTQREKITKLKFYKKRKDL